MQLLIMSNPGHPGQELTVLGATHEPDTEASDSTAFTFARRMTVSGLGVECWKGGELMCVIHKVGKSSTTHFISKTESK